MSTITAHDVVVELDGEYVARVEYVERDVQLVNAYGDRWQIPTEYFELVASAVRGGAPATWRISAAWTDAMGQACEGCLAEPGEACGPDCLSREA